MLNFFSCQSKHNRPISGTSASTYKLIEPYKVECAIGLAMLETPVPIPALKLENIGPGHARTADCFGTVGMGLDIYAA